MRRGLPDLAPDQPAAVGPPDQPAPSPVREPQRGPPATSINFRSVLHRLPASIVLAATALLVVAAPALAHDNGEGWYGETNDRVVTNAGFILIIFFPLFIFLVSVLQWRLEKRKYARMAAAKRAAQSANGW
jgi:peptidoglycan biosynthesis protein MviN/MurJ (putative lipid II flippase)